MFDTNEALKRHLSNVIYIEDEFGLDLFKLETEESDKKLNSITARNSDLKEQEVTPCNEGQEVILSDDKEKMSIEAFFCAAQKLSSINLNILPYYYDKNSFWKNIGTLKNKLGSFPLIIIDWQLDDSADKKTGLDVFEEICKETDVLHYYAIYSNEISQAVDAFKLKYSDKKDHIAENEIVVLNNNAVVLFCDKMTTGIEKIVNRLINFTESQYGYFPQLFLDFKQQIEDQTSSLYNQINGLDSMILPQLFEDEFYKFEGLAQELLKNLAINKLNENLKIKGDEYQYFKLSICRLLKIVSNESTHNVSFDKLPSAFKDILGLKDEKVYQKHLQRCKDIINADYWSKDFISALRRASNYFSKGEETSLKGDEISDDEKKQIKNFILFVSICGDPNYNNNFKKFIALIKLNEYKGEKSFSLYDFSNSADSNLCQGDIYINEENQYLLCVSPACQLLRPEKIKSTYMFLKGKIEENINDNKKQYYKIDLIDYNDENVIPVCFSLFDPLVIKKSDIMEDPYKNYIKKYNLHMEYTHKIIEMFSEYIKLIGVEEPFCENSKVEKIFVKR